MNFKDLAISKKLIGVFALILTVTIALGLFAQYSLSQVDDVASDISSNWLPSVKVLGQYEYAITRIRANQNNQYMQISDKARATSVANLQKYKTLADVAWTKYKPMITQGTEQGLADKIAAARAAYDESLAKNNEIFNSSGGEAAAAFAVGDSRNAFNTLVAAVDETSNSMTK